MAKVFKIMVPDNSLISRTLYNESLSTELYVIDRADTKFIADHSEDLSKPALYILANRDEKKLYVGKTGDSLTRLHNHKSKEFWTEAIVYHSTPGTDTLSTTEVEWLEAKTYEEIKSLGYYDLSENTQKPKYPTLKRDQEINCPEYFETAKNYICAAGFDIFLKREGNKEQMSKPTENKKEVPPKYRMPPIPPFRFSIIGLKKGDKVIFDPLNIEVTVASDNTINYKGKEYKLTTFCKEFLPEDKRTRTNTYQGPAYFSYQGKSLKKIRKEREKIN